MLRGSLGLGLLLCFSTVLVDRAQAQDSETGGGLEEVVVTARKRAENAQDVPIAITTLSDAKLKELGANNMGELVEHVPNFDWDPVGINALSSWGLRGIVDQSRNAGQESGLGIYVDGVFVGRPVGFNASLADVEQVEVLRGPQGSLYGRNTIAGAVNITTRRPTNNLGVNVDVNVGNYSRRDADVGISGPLISGVLTGKISAFEQRNDGYVHNVADGRDLLNENRQGGRAAIFFTPTESLEVRLSGDIMHQDHRTAFGLSAEPQLNIAIPTWYYADRFTTNQNDANFEKIDVGGGSLLVNWTLPNGVLFTSITADRINNFDLDNDDDAGPITLTHSHFVDKSAMFSQELRLTSKQGGAYDYVVGLYYLDENVRSNRHTAVVPYPAQDLGILDVTKVGTRSYAGFGNLNVHFAPTWTLGVGLRYTLDRKDGNFLQSVNVPLGFQSSLTEFPGVRRTDKQISGDVTLTWKPAEELLAYGTVRKGFKSGGFQTDIIDFSDVASFSFKPETAVTYELGLKTEALHRRVRLNGAIFDTEYKDMQVSQLVGLGFTTNNAGKSRIRGVELELEVAPVEHLTLGVSGGLLDAKYLQFPNCDPLGLGTDCSGNRLQFTPRWNLGTTVDYRVPFTAGAIVFHADTSSRGYEYSDALNQDGVRTLSNGALSWPLKIGGYTLVGARFGYETSDRAWGVYAWGKNLTDKGYDLRRWRYPIIPVAFGAVGAQGIEFVPGQPRTWGVELTYRH
jgi:iron complex outermembrane recepter protein